MLSNLQKRLKAKRHIKGLKSKKSLLLTQRMLASQRRDGYWLREVDSDLQIVNELLRSGQNGDRYWISQIDSDLEIVNELLEEALSDFKNKRYRLP